MIEADNNEIELFGEMYILLAGNPLFQYAVNCYSVLSVKQFNEFNKIIDSVIRSFFLC